MGKYPSQNGLKSSGAVPLCGRPTGGEELHKKPLSVQFVAACAFFA